MKRRYGRNRKEHYLVSFGLGLLACFVLPAKVMILVLGIALVICGLSAGNHS